MDNILSSLGFKKKPPVPTYIPVTIDKSHLITIGEKLYTESLELVRELVNNAYDADAINVDVFVSDELIRVQDDGNGMDLKGLKQYFNIGSPYKYQNQKSPRFERQRIGQFGIGKFASLSACQRFEVYTQKDDFAARVVFDKKQWEENKSNWYLPLEITSPDLQQKNGTRVTLYDLFKKFDLIDVEKTIQESVPLKTRDFIVRLNGRQMMAKQYEGQRVPLLEGSSFGPIHGEVIILPLSQSSLDEAGIEVKVKQVTVKRELFGMEAWGALVGRIRGEIHADFLPITSDRSGFVKDSPEYIELIRVMAKVVKELKKSLSKILDKKEKRRASRALNEALERIYRALSLNPDISPFGALPIGNPNQNMGKKAAINNKQKSLLDPLNQQNNDSEATGQNSETTKEVEIPKRLKQKSKTIKKLSPEAVVKKMRFGKMAISCCLDHFGVDGPECQTEGTVVFLNRDHPLYKRAEKGTSTYTMHIARLLAQEIALMKDPRSPRHAFTRQSKLLKDAFVDE